MEATACWCSHHLFFRRPWLLGTDKYLLSPYMCHHTPWGGNVFTLSIRNHKYLPIASRAKGNSTTIGEEGTCKILWTVEADLVEGQFLYLTGDPSVLGSWKKDMAVLMSPTDQNYIWKAEIMISPGLNFKYNYFFVKEDSQHLCDITWRPGPEFSLSVPVLKNQDKEIVVRDSWMHSITKTPRTYDFWDSWMDDELVNCEESDDSLKLQSLLENDHLNHFNNNNKPCSDDDIFSVIARGISDSSTSSNQHQPVEEPWFCLQSPSFSSSSIILHRDSEMPPGVSELKEEIEEEMSELKADQASDYLLPEGLISCMDSVSTVILINSSLCTMQRIAVLEDDKLVELLLEPVKSDVLCDSLYLGVVTKLVPNMGGAFVNIGSSRPSLMDIKHFREPFVFPPFQKNGSEQYVSHETVRADHNTEVDFHDDPMHDDYEDHDDLDVLQLIKENTNGSLSSSESQPLRIHENKWARVQKGTKIAVQVVKEGLGTKGPTLTAYPKLKSRFWVLSTRCDRVGVSKKISGVERIRLKVIAKTLQPEGFGMTVRTVAAGHSIEELQKDLEGLLSTWKNIMEHAKSAALAADEGVEGAIPVILHRAMGQTLSIVQDYFNDKVKSMVVDSPRTFYEVTNYLEGIAPDLCDRVQLYDKGAPLFDEFNIEEEINSILSKRVPLINGGSLVIEQTEALVSIDVNGGHGMFGQGNSQEKAILEVNLAAAKQIARELRLRDIGGIIVVDFIDMIDESNKRMVYEEIKKAVERDRSMVKVSELSRYGLMEITRKRVRPSVTFMISEPCPCCHATGRVEALETSFAKIEQEICRLLAKMEQKTDPENPKSWPRFILRVDHYMCNYLTAGKRTRLAILSSSLRVWILLKVDRGFTRGAFEMKPFVEDNNDNNNNNNNQKRQGVMPMLRPSSNSRKVTLFPVKKWKTRRK